MFAVMVLLPACLGLLGLLGRLATENRKLKRNARSLAAENEELRTASEAQRRFVARLAHELRNPLSAVLGFSELMSSGRGGSVTGSQREHLDVIHTSADHTLALVEDLLDLSRVESGQLRLEAAPVDPATVLKACVNSLARIAEQRRVTVELDATQGDAVLVDRTRLRQIVLNLLSNAIKFSPAGSRVRVSLCREDGAFRVSVSDQGPGIAPEYRNRVFDEFFQVPGSEGTGLGLAVTKSIVVAQGGRIELSSHPGRGSTFVAWLPAEAALRTDPEIRITRRAPARVPREGFVASP